MPARSPRRQSSVASSPRAGAPGPRGAPGTARPVPGSPRARPLAQPLARSRRPRPAGRAWAPARRPPSAAPRGDTRRRPRHRVPREPLLRLSQVYSNPSSRRRILPRRERWKLGGRSWHRQPLPGVGTPSTLFCQERARRQPGSCSRCDPAPPRLAAEPSRGPRAELPGPPEPRVAAEARGLRDQEPLAPSCPIGAGPGARRAAGGRRSASQGRRASATDTCLQGSSRRARGAPSGSASCRPGGRWPAPCQLGPSSRSSSLRSPAVARPGRAPAPVPSGSGAWLPPVQREDGSAPLRRALSVHFCLPPLLPGCSRQRLPPRDTHAHSHTATRKPILATPWDLRNPRRQGTLPGLPLPPPAGRVVELREALLLSGSGVGSPGSNRMGGYGTRQARLRDGDCSRGTRGRVSMIPAGRAGERSGLGPLRPGLLPPARRTSPVAARLCVGCCLPSTWALRMCSLYFSPFPRSPRGSRGTARASPPRPTAPAVPLVRSRPPWLCRGV